MKLFALIGAGLLAAGTIVAAPVDAQNYGQRDGYSYGHRGYGYGHRSYGYRRAEGYRRHGYYRGGGWRHRSRYARCRYRRCW